jgi:site-specific recombinase XerD
MLNNNLNKVRDVFLFSCYTGLSYIDLYNLSLKNIRKGYDGLQWIFVKRQKTDIPSTLPILPYAFSILKKYKKEKNVNRIFPMISNQKTNKALKEIAHLCNFNKKLTFHSARHTFATTITLTNGVPIESVSKMLGHNNIKTTQIYARVIESKISSDMLKLRKKSI